MVGVEQPARTANADESYRAGSRREVIGIFLRTVFEAADSTPVAAQPL